jgi:hypothetical protein
MTTDSFLFDAGSLFFVAWIAVLAGVSIAAFGRDLLPTKAHPNPARKSHPADRIRPSQPSAR